MKEAFVGFDSAWGGHRAGAIAWAIFQDEVPENTPPPSLVGFADAAEIIEDLQRECDDVLVAIDQPIIVPNDLGERPVDTVADAFMQQLNSTALKANRTEPQVNIYLHGDEGPVWKFMRKIGPSGYFGRTNTNCSGIRAFVDFEVAHTPSGDTHVIEVYPALALPALNPIFMERGSAARYDPQSRNLGYPFSLEDWQLVCETVRDCAADLDLELLSQWAMDMVQPWDSPRRPRKIHQDKIDAALCLIVALQWRRQANGVSVIGDLENGYIVTPTSDRTREILQEACKRNGVCFSGEEHERLRQAEKAGTPDFIEHLLAIPKAPDDDSFELPPRTRDFSSKEIAL